MRTIKVNTKDKYEILVGDVFNDLLNYVKGRKFLVVTDSNVDGIYNAKELFKTDFVHVVKPGEESKSFDTYSKILDVLIDNDFNRNDLIISFGGGVIGDVASFVAATYQRGIDYISAPTSLLSMIDSCVGGKCAINYKGLKNYVGAFYQPKKVFVNPKFLKTLPNEEFKSGIGEGIKYLALIGMDLYESITNLGNDEFMEEFIFRCLDYKSKIVSIDEKDDFERKVLNLGHTIAHAIEEDSMYEISHGIAVANGVYMMAKASCLNNRLSSSELEIIEEVFDLYDIDMLKFSTKEDLLKYIAKDKKIVSNNEIDAVIINALGDCNISRFELDKFVDYIAKSIV